MFKAIGQTLSGTPAGLAVEGGKLAGHSGKVWVGGDCAAGGEDLTVTWTAAGGATKYQLLLTTPDGTAALLGETAALIYTAGTVPEVATSLTSSSRTISVHLYCLLNEGLYTEQAYATAVVLIIFVVIINALSNFLAKKIIK